MRVRVLLTKFDQVELHDPQKAFSFLSASSFLFAKIALTLRRRLGLQLYAVSLSATAQQLDITLLLEHHSNLPSGTTANQATFARSWLATMSTSATNPAPTPTESSLSRDLVGVLVILLNPSTEADRQRYYQLQRLRQKHDQAFDRWLPHIALIPPFTLSSPCATSDEIDLKELTEHHEPRLTSIAQAAFEVCKNHEHHQLLIDQVSTFPLKKYTYVHLRPSPTNFPDKGSRSASKHAPDGNKTGQDTSSRRIVELQKELSNIVTPLLRPNAEKVTKGRNVFKPHVSVGQSTSPKATWQLCTSAEEVLHGEVGKNGGGMLCDVDRVHFMVKRKGQEGPYTVHKELLLTRSTQT